MHKISEFAKRIDRSFEVEDPKTATEIYNLLDELKLDGKVILKSINSLFRGIVKTGLISQGSDPYPVT